MFILVIIFTFTITESQSSHDWYASWFQEMQSHPQVVKAISACLSEDGEVQDSASDELRAARGKLRGVENRLKALLKGHSGEVSEMVCC